MRRWRAAVGWAVILAAAITLAVAGHQAITVQPEPGSYSSYTKDTP